MRHRARTPTEAGPGHEETPDVGPALPPPVDVIEQLMDLDELRGEGILTDEEFSAEKKKLLD